MQKFQEVLSKWDIQKLGLFNFSKQYIDFFIISVPNSLQ